MHLSWSSLYSYALHLQSYRIHVKEISGNFKSPVRVDFDVLKKIVIFLKIQKWQDKLVGFLVGFLIPK